MLMSAAARMCIRRRVSVCVNTQQIWLQEINFLAMICVGASVWYSSRSLIHSLTRFPFTVLHEIVSISLLFHSTFTFIWNLTSHSNRAINTLMIAPLLVVQIFHFFVVVFVLEICNALMAIRAKPLHIIPRVSHVDHTQTPSNPTNAFFFSFFKCYDFITVRCNIVVEYWSKCRTLIVCPGEMNAFHRVHAIISI